MDTATEMHERHGMNSMGDHRSGWRRWRAPPPNPDRPQIERQGNLMFWVTLAAALAIVVIAVVLGLVI